MLNVPIFGFEMAKAKTRQIDKYKDPAKMKAKAQEYFNACEVNGESYTLTGLVLHLGLNSRSNLRTYRERAEFKEAVDWMMLHVENRYEVDLMNKNKNFVGAMFALKNMGWSDGGKSSDNDEPVKDTEGAITVIIRK